jgi:hypothetical protein
LIICRHVLEHLWHPRDLIMTVREAVGDRDELMVYFEVPNGDFILREQAFWELHYQHVSYFTKSSLTQLFTECGFEAREVRENFGDQYLGIQAYATADSVVANANSPGGEHTGTAALDRASCGGAFRARVAKWQDHIKRLGAIGQFVVAWGAGAKAVTFLSIVDPAGDVISHVVDVNPRKVGRFTPGSAREIIAPRALQELRPDVILVMNGIYKDEIGATVHALGLDPVFLVV